MDSSNAFADTTFCPELFTRNPSMKKFFEIVYLAYLHSSNRPQQHKEDREPLNKFFWKHISNPNRE